MVRKHQSISQHNILPPPYRKHHHLRNVLGRERFHPFIHLLRLLLITAKPYNAKLRLHLPWIDFNDADAAGDELLAHRVGEGAYGGFGRAVDAAALVGFPPRDGSDVYDITLPA